MYYNYIEIQIIDQQILIKAAQWPKMLVAKGYYLFAKGL